MKRLASILLLTSTLFGTTLTLYTNNKALVDTTQALYDNTLPLLEGALEETLLVPDTVESFVITTQRPKSLHLSGREKIEKIHLLYLIDTLGFKARYTLALDEKKGRLNGDFLITNRSNTAITYRRLRFVPATVYLKRTPHVYRAKALSNTPNTMQKRSLAATPMFVIDAKGSLPPKSISFRRFLQETIPYDRTLVAYANDPRYFQGTQSDTPQIEIAFKAPEALAQGSIYVYKEDRFLGSARIANTPQNTPLHLHIGKDMTTIFTQKVLRYQKNDRKRHYNSTVAYSIRNTAQSAKRFKLLIPCEAACFVDTDLPYKRIDASHIMIKLGLAPKSVKNFTIDFKRN